MRRKRQLVLGERGVELSGPSREEPSAALAVGERRGALETTSVALVPSEDLDGLVSSAELDERFDQIDGEPARAGLGDRLPTNEREGRLEVRNNVLGCAEDEREVAERLPGDEVFVGVARRFEHSTSCVSRLLEPTQLGLNEGLERKVVHGKETADPTGRPPPSRFGHKRAPLRGFRGAARRRRGGTEATVERSRRRGRAHVGSARRQPCVPARANRPTSSTRRERPVAGRGCAGRPRSPAVPQPCRPSLAALVRPSNASADEPRYEHIRGQRVVADLQRQSEGGLGVPQHLVEPLEHPDAGRGEALVGDRERLAIWPRPRRRPGRTARPLRPVPRRGGSARESTVARARCGPGGSGAITVTQLGFGSA